MLPEVVATPLPNVIAVVDPKAIATPLLFVTVGAVTGLVDEFAPENVRFLEPVYDVAVLPYPSWAVIVRS